LGKAKLSTGKRYFRPKSVTTPHACGYALVNREMDTRALQAYLGHRNIQHTVRYTELSAARFKGIWRKHK
jgi:type 1 fimbriae regulatory protein FimB/type 1 fimbriae regulatory protein FimE